MVAEHRVACGELDQSAEPHAGECEERVLCCTDFSS